MQIQVDVVQSGFFQVQAVNLKLFVLEKKTLISALGTNMAEDDHEESNNQILMAWLANVCPS